MQRRTERIGVDLLSTTKVALAAVFGTLAFLTVPTAQAETPSAEEVIASVAPYVAGAEATDALARHKVSIADSAPPLTAESLVVLQSGRVAYPGETIFPGEIIFTGAVTWSDDDARPALAIGAQVSKIDRGPLVVWPPGGATTLGWAMRCTCKCGEKYVEVDDSDKRNCSDLNEEDCVTDAGTLDKFSDCKKRFIDISESPFDIIGVLW